MDQVFTDDQEQDEEDFTKPPTKEEPAIGRNNTAQYQTLQPEDRPYSIDGLGDESYLAVSSQNRHGFRNYAQPST
jgi:hypothetical protein